MGNFEMRYPVHGSAALKPSSAEKSQSATIIEFPAIAQNEFDWESLEQNSAAAQPSDFSQLKALFRTNISTPAFAACGRISPRIAWVAASDRASAKAKASSRSTEGWYASESPPSSASSPT